MAGVENYFAVLKEYKVYQTEIGMHGKVPMPIDAFIQFAKTGNAE